jgi:hypothetical protein
MPHVTWHSLQYDRVGFRIDGGALYSYANEAEAIDAL